MNFRRIVAKVSTAAFALMLPWSATAADHLGKVTSVADGDTFTMESETGKVRVRIAASTLRNAVNPDTDRRPACWPT
jgi:endonuclease YncB( thermonuclease family)